MRRPLGLAASLLCIVVGAGIGLVATGASANARFDRGGIVIRVPRGWSLTRGRINGVLDPVTVFTVSTFRLRPGGVRLGGTCSPVLRRAWKRDGGYVQLTEERDGASRTRMLHHVEHRPQHFHLNGTGWGGLCTPPNSGELSFQEHGRAFYLFYGFGRHASPRLRAQAAAMLDAMLISPRS